MPPYKKSNTPCVNYSKGICTNTNCPNIHVPSKPPIDRYINPTSQSRNNNNNNNNNIIDNNNNNKVLSALLQLIFEKQGDILYNNNKGMLSLDSFLSLPEVYEVRSTIDFNNPAFCSVLCSVIRQSLKGINNNNNNNSGQLIILSVDSNDIKAPSVLLNALKHEGLHINISSLSMANNNISSSHFLHVFKEYTQLKEIVLRGNPIADTDGYKRELRRRIQSLIMVDGAAVHSTPLMLPWPIVTAPSASDSHRNVENNIKEFISNNVFSNILSFQKSPIAGSMDAIAPYYHNSVIFTLSMGSPDHAIRREAHHDTNNKEALRDTNEIHTKQKDDNHNLCRGIKRTAVGCGRADALSKMSRVLYPKAFYIQHTFASEISIYISPDVLGQRSNARIATYTTHGVISYTHRQCPDYTFSRCFDRTFVLIDAPDGISNNNIINNNININNSPYSWKVVNDFVQIRPNADNSVFYPGDRYRCERIGRRCGTSAEIVSCLVTLVRSDQELMALLSDIPGITNTELEGLVNGCNGDIRSAINIKRIMTRRGVCPEEAYGLLMAANGDVDSVLYLNDM